jgi:hypothetical protein
MEMNKTDEIVDFFQSLNKVEEDPMMRGAIARYLGAK